MIANGCEEDVALRGRRALQRGRRLLRCARMRRRRSPLLSCPAEPVLWPRCCRDGRARYSVNERQRGVDRRCKQGGTVECNSYIPPLSHIRGGIFYFAPRITGRRHSHAKNRTIYTFENPEYRKTYWHTCSHIMAQAVKRLHPEVQLAIGPGIDNGFYYDFDSALRLHAG